MQAPKPCTKGKIHGITTLITLLKFLTEQWKNKQTCKHISDNKLVINTLGASHCQTNLIYGRRTTY